MRNGQVQLLHDGTGFGASRDDANRLVDFALPGRCRAVALIGCPALPPEGSEPEKRARILCVLFKPFWVIRDLLVDGGTRYPSYDESWAAYERVLRRRAERFERLLTPAGEAEDDPRARVFSREWLAWHTLAVIRHLDYHVLASNPPSCVQEPVPSLGGSLSARPIIRR